MSFSTLAENYRNRLAAARSAHAAGTRVVGLIGNTIPRELVLASGAFPVLIAAELGNPTPNANVYMEDVIPPETKALFELATGGALEFLDLLVLSRPYAHLYYYLKEVYRLGRAPRLPVLHMFDLMQSQREAVRTYNAQQLVALIDRLQRATGQDLSIETLRTAIELTNRVRGVHRELLDRRWQRMLSGVDALQAIGAGYFMLPEAYAAALTGYLNTLAPVSALAERPRLLVLPSEPLPDVSVHRALEDAGALVVAEDDWWGARAPGQDIPVDESPKEAILRKYWLDAGSANVIPAEAREKWFRATAVRDDVDGVVFYLPPSDHQLGWDYPRLKAWLDSIGKPSLRLRTDAAERIHAEVADWLPTLVSAGVAAR